MVGGAGSANAMRDIKAGDTVLKATVIYPSDPGRRRHPTGPAARRRTRAMRDLVEVEVPREVVLYAPVVTKDNVEQYMPTALRVLTCFHRKPCSGRMHRRPSNALPARTTKGQRDDNRRNTRACGSA